MIGGTVALWLADEYRSVPASVSSIAVLNGVVMVRDFNQFKALGR